ncbi:MAG: hypothetical protein JXR96_17685 [Deltaproteobacteria bacterium]|nr:hypothetical protein [Deltaproteobacteria bacterium]
MAVPRLTQRLPLVLLAAALLAACSQEERLRSWCASDMDCPPGYRCDPETGLCLCATDEVCGPDEYCAPDGRCRRSTACDSNLDCPEDEYCDSTTGNCIPKGICTSDKQCPLGQICSPTRFRCVPGCRENGDCPLGSVCRDDACQEDLCEDKSFCDYGQLCDEVSETCYDDDRGPYCEPCQPVSPTNPFSCGPGPNFCIMTGNDPSLPPFCGVDCDDGQECPNGYTCSRILTAPDGDCQRGEDCPSGKCHINEGDTVGFCLCASDSECPQDRCDEGTMQCVRTRKQCTPGGMECDRPIYCIEGLCLLGRNCTPAEGLRCADVLR